MSDGLSSDDQLEPSERALGERLEAAKPVPSPGFRGALGRHLAARDPGYGPRLPQLRLIASACLGGSAILLALGALQAIGAL